MISGNLTSYTLRNSSETPVEEDSVYNIFLIAVNSDGRSMANITEISTLKDGILLIMIPIIYLAIFISSPHWNTYQPQRNGS